MTKRKFLKVIKSQDHIWIYGAGNICKKLINWLVKNGILENKISIVVSQLNGNPSNVGKIKVQEISAANIMENEMIVIATYSNFHAEILEKLNQYGIFNVVVQSDEFYRNLNSKNKFYEKVNDLKNKLYKFILIKFFSRMKLKNYIILESHDDYDGNSGAICNAITNRKQKGKYKIIWMVQNPENFKDNKNKGIRYQKIGEDKSFLDMYYHYMAKYIFFDNRIVRKMRKEQISVYLTHGTNPLKNVKGIINLPDEVDYVLVTSEDLIDLASEQYGVTRDKFFVCGQPRSDAFFDKSQDIYKLVSKNEYKKIIVWMPTFRQHCRTSRCDTNKRLLYGIPVIESEQELKKLEKYLEEENVLLIIKPHPIQNLTYIKIKDTHNIRVVTNEILRKKQINMYGFLAGTDALISDYSNVTFDYLLGDKPVAYARERDEYKLELEENYHDYMMGPVLGSVDEIINFISDVVEGKDGYKEEREKVRNRMHVYIDNKNTERVIERFLIEEEDNNGE